MNFGSNYSKTSSWCNKVDNKKFACVVYQIDIKKVNEIDEVIYNPLSGGKYDVLKNALIKHLFNSDFECAKTIGDRTV